ncbi:unnamed protein product [Cylicocyclus nassatus]|uniref:Saposin B-type domain-containing protein n=1 Tax=Cylicocyclus nassatus TaxID=53992 RepID=A0AA36GTA0_CYLNA|nr:unnamed protein product [Cylicocyclus nassatus]
MNHQVVIIATLCLLCTGKPSEKCLICEDLAFILRYTAELKMKKTPEQVMEYKCKIYDFKLQATCKDVASQLAKNKKAMSHILNNDNKWEWINERSACKSNLKFC